MAALLTIYAISVLICHATCPHNILHQGHAKLKVTDTELDALETEIAVNPQVGDVIRGLKGVRKIRFALAGKGKRGGGRCIYLVLAIEGAFVHSRSSVGQRSLPLGASDARRTKLRRE